jgi:hypothetical protein
MGACLKLPAAPPEVRLTLPGGLQLSSLSSATQSIPNSMDPFQSLLTITMPALGPIKPVFDIVGFVMCTLEFVTSLGSIIGGLLTFTGAIGNPLSLLFPLPNLKGPNGKDTVPPIPDPSAAVVKLVDSLQCLIGKGIKVAALTPQLSVAATVKDAILTAIQFLDAIMGQVNSLVDQLSKIPPANTGIAAVDAKLTCVGENAQLQIQAKLSVAGALQPLMAAVSTIAQAASRPLPRGIYTAAALLANPPPTGFGTLPFPDAAAREGFLKVLDDMTTTGLPFEIPDFSDLSDLPALVTKMKTQLAPVLQTIQLLQMILDKIARA